MLDRVTFHPAPSRYLNADLTVNRAAVEQAAEAEARGRHEAQGRTVAMLAARRMAPIRARTLAEFQAEARARYLDMAEGYRAAELHFREHGRPYYVAEVL